MNPRTPRRALLPPGPLAAGLALWLLASSGGIPPTVEELSRPPLSIEDVVMLSRARVEDRAFIAKIQPSRIEPCLDPWEDPDFRWPFGRSARGEGNVPRRAEKTAGRRERFGKASLTFIEPVLRIRAHETRDAHRGGCGARP